MATNIVTRNRGSALLLPIVGDTALSSYHTSTGGLLLPPCTNCRSAKARRSSILVHCQHATWRLADRFDPHVAERVSFNGVSRTRPVQSRPPERPRRCYRAGDGLGPRRAGSGAILQHRRVREHRRIRASALRALWNCRSQYDDGCVRNSQNSEVV